jgi:hypothetical protein
MSAKKADEKKQAPATATQAPAPATESPEEVVANSIIAELDRVHVRTPRN